jgi:hypothetical protein
MSVKRGAEWVLRTAASFLIVLLITMSGQLLVTPAVRAQDQEAPLPVSAYACDEFVTIDNSAKGEGLPDSCRTLEGVTIVGLARDGTELGRCITNADGVCQLPIGLNGTRIFVQSETGIPDGYRPVSQAQRVFTYSEFAEVHFVNYREDVIPGDSDGTAIVRVESRVCPDKYSGDVFATDCGEQLSGNNEYIFANGMFGTTGTDGNARVREVPAGQVAVIGAQSETTGDVFFSCSATGDPAAAQDTSVTLTAELDGVTRDFSGNVTVANGDDVTCLWYQIPQLDRGLWTTLSNPMATGDREGTWIDETGLINLFVVACPADYQAADLEDAAANCTGAPQPFGVSATGADGQMLASGGLADDGEVVLNLSGKPIEDFMIGTADRTDLSLDVIGCFANGDDQSGDNLDPMQQNVEIGDGTWSVPGFGDDLRGITCVWYLAG